MKELTIFCVIVVLIYLIYTFRHYIIWFFNVVKVTLKNKKTVKDLQKKGINRRNLKNEEIEEYIKYSIEKLNEKGIKIKKDFMLKPELERKLRYSRFSEKYVLELLNNILDYMELDRERVELKVNYISSKYNIDYAGAYYDTTNKTNVKQIVINIKNNMTMDTVISVLAHECTHYLLFSNGIKLEDRKRNECLTDITAIIMGYGKFMKEGYKISNQVTYDTEYYINVNKERTGYLSYKDVEYAIKKLKKYLVTN